MKARRNDAGFTFLEAVIALAILGILIGAGFYEVRHVAKAARQMKLQAGLDNLETFLHDVLPQRDVIRSSIKRSSASRLRRCILDAASSCEHNKTYRIPMYLGASGAPISGQSAKYDLGGNLCASGKDCGIFRVVTEVITYCAGASGCTVPAQVAVRYSIRSPNNRILRSAVLEQEPSDVPLDNVAAACGEDQLLRGIGMNGEALCVPFDLVKLDNGKALTATTEVRVKPKDCRTLAGVGDPQDAHVVVGINPDGELQCAPKTW